MAKIQYDLKTKDAELKTLKDGIERIRKVILPNNTEATLNEIEEEIKNNTTKKLFSVKKEIQMIGNEKTSLRKSIKKVEKEKILIKSELRTTEAKRMEGLKKYERSFPPERDQMASITSLPQGFRHSIRKDRDPRETISLPLSTASITSLPQGFPS